MAEGCLKISLLYDGHGAQWKSHGGFNAERLCDSPHGISGTELQLFGHAEELAAMGHDVHIFSVFQKTEGCSWQRMANGMPWGKLTMRQLHGPREACDIAIAYHDGRPLDRWEAKRKVLMTQVFLTPNRQQDATFTGADFADIYLTASDHVAAHLEQAYGWPEVKVVPNAWNMGRIQEWNPVPGRIVYTTSIERGFHRLIEAFPFIRQRVPNAHIVAFGRGGPAVDTLRANPVDGVTLIGASSRNEVLKVLATGAVFGYPCDVSLPTEVFPVSMLEACATGVPVVFSDEDGVGELFGSGVMLSSSVKRNPSGWRDDFVGRVVGMLTQPDLAAYWSQRGQKFAAPYRFSETTKILAAAVGL